MKNRKEIHNFAVKWSNKFKDDNINYIELVDHYIADDCSALGFIMDCGKSFDEKHGQAVNDDQALKEIINKVDDIELRVLLFILDGVILITGRMMGQIF